MKIKKFLRGLALTALALFLLTSTALAEPPVSVDVAIATISASAKTLAPGDTFPLSLLYKYPVAADEPLQWVNSNETVASLSGTDGLAGTTVTALKDGRATIRLVGTRSLKTLAKCQVTVRTVKISSFSISRRALTIAPNQDFTLAATVKPSNATYRTVGWTSDKPLVATVNGGASATGGSVMIHSLATGTARITAQTPTGRKLICTVTVKDLSISSVKFPKSKYTFYLKDSNPARLTATVSPATTGIPVTYASSDESVAEIDRDTGVMTLKATGFTTITASAGGKSGTCKVTVASKDIKSLSIATPKGAAVVLDPVRLEDQTAQLTAVPSPAYADNQEVEWTTDASGVATVDESGLVTAVAGGVARVTATSKANPAAKATVTVHVRGGADMRTVTISAAGDAVLGGDPRSLKGGAANPFSDQEFQAAILKAGDVPGTEAPNGSVFQWVDRYFAGENNIATFNLEGTLTNKRSYGSSKPFVFRGLPGYATALLKNHNIDAVCVANNHSYDVGTAGYNDTKANLNRAGVRPYGNGTVASVTSENGLKVGFLGFVSKGMSVGSMTSQIRSAAKRYDMVVVAFHWTDVSEFRYAAPSSRQKSLARAAVSAGADLVLGHHTHRLNTIERYKGKYIVYDMGNFVTIAKNPLNAFLSNNPQGKYDYDSMIYQQDFHVWTDGFVEAGDITIVPCAITSAYTSQVNTCQPTPYTASGDIDRVMATIRKYSPADFSDYPINKKTT